MRDASAEPGAGEAGDKETPSKTGYSADEILRHKDLADLTHEEFDRIAQLIAGLASRRPKRRSRRLRPDHRGRELDLRRLVRASLATGGDPAERAFRRRIEKSGRRNHFDGIDAGVVGAIFQSGVSRDIRVFGLASGASSHGWLRG